MQRLNGIWHMANANAEVVYFQTGRLKTDDF